MYISEKAMATHSSVLAWRIPGTEEPGGQLSMGLHRVRYNWSDLAAAAEYIMRNAGLEEAQAGIKIAGRNINKLRYTDAAAAAAAKSLQLYLTLRNPIDGSPPGSPIPGILQARTLE